MTTHRTAFDSAHITALLFGIFGALIHVSASVITLGRAGFVMLALAAFALIQKRPNFRGLNRSVFGIFILSGLLLAAHCVTVFIAVKVGVIVATLGFASFLRSLFYWISQFFEIGSISPKQFCFLL